MNTGVARKLVKRAAFATLGSAPVLTAKLARIRATKALTILNLHRVAPDDGSAYRPLAPSLFEQLLIFVNRHFQPVTFGTLDQHRSGTKPPVILSFDDGYADFAEYAAPLLRKHGVRVNQNIIPECVERGRPPLNVLMQDFVGRAPQPAVDALEVSGFASDTPRSDRDAFGHALSSFLKARPMAEQAALADILLPQVEREPGFQPTAIMSRDQIRALAKEYEFGAHSYAHASLGHESDDYLRQDVARCRAWFERELGQPMTVYAMPNGSYRPGQIELIRDSGVKSILLVDEDFSDVGGDVHRRFTFDARSLAEMRFKATGGFKWPG